MGEGGVEGVEEEGCKGWKRRVARGGRGGVQGVEEEGCKGWKRRGARGGRGVGNLK